MTIFGLILGGLALVAMSAWTPATSLTMVGLAMAAFGLGFGLTVTARSTAAVERAGEAAFGVASATVTVARMIGMAIGLAVLTASQKDNGKSMIGMLIEVYTTDNMEFLYEAVAVRRHITNLDSAFATTDETLWLQTSEGPVGTVQKVQVIAKPLSSGPADPTAAHPKANPIVCG